MRRWDRWGSSQKLAAAPDLTHYYKYFATFPESLALSVAFFFFPSHLRISCRHQAPLPFNILVEYFGPWEQEHSLT